MDNPEHTQAELVSFRLRGAFPVNDPLSVPLLRLMAATNDARHMVRLLTALHDGIETLNDSEKLLRAAEFGYLVRMLCGHLHEAGIAIRGIWTNAKARKRAQRLLRTFEDGGAAFEQVRAQFMDYSAGSIRYVLEHIRNHAAFHYLHQDFEVAHRNHPDESALVIATASGFSRYLVTDGFASFAIQQIVGPGYDDYTREVGRVFALSSGLATAVDHLLVGFFKERESAILRQETVSIAIPHEIRRQREYAESLKTSTDKAAEGLRHRE